MMDPDTIIAVVVTVDQQEIVQTGDVPILIAQDVTEQEKIAVFLSRTTKSMIHQLPNGVQILIRH